MLIKICGATSPADVDMVAGLGVDYVGLWHGTGGRHELDLATLARLSAHAAGRVRPVLVTLAGDPRLVAAAAHAAGVVWVQLHGFQPPAAVRHLKAAGLSVIKALHVRAEQCVEQPLIPAYQRAGVDLFLLDTLTDDGRVGSTGRRLAPAAVAAVAARLRRPYLLAGGVGADRSAFAGTPEPYGIDVDSAARGDDGALCPQRTAGVVGAWRAPVD